MKGWTEGKRMDGEDSGDDRGLSHHAKRCLGKKILCKPEKEINRTGHLVFEGNKHLIYLIIRGTMEITR